MAIGPSAVAAGSGSVVVGEGAVFGAAGRGVVIGSQAQVGPDSPGDGVVVLGSDATAWGDKAVAIGASANVYGYGTIGIGRGAIANNQERAAGRS